MNALFTGSLRRAAAVDRFEHLTDLAVAVDTDNIHLLVLKIHAVRHIVETPELEHLAGLGVKERLPVQQVVLTSEVVMIDLHIGAINRAVVVYAEDQFVGAVDLLHGEHPVRLIYTEGTAHHRIHVRDIGQSAGLHVRIGTETRHGVNKQSLIFHGFFFELLNLLVACALFLHVFGDPAVHLFGRLTRRSGSAAVAERVKHSRVDHGVRIVLRILLVRKPCVDLGLQLF